tara:strand:- start:123 stop:608 length:486 start_codon:yes stop_codon:yes gene_type:complete
MEPSATGGAIIGIIYLIIGVVVIAAFWKINTKAGQPGWACIIPIYNLIVLMRIVGKPAWWIVLLLVPIVNLVILIITTHALSKSFGKGAGFTIGILLLGIVFYPILGFGSDPYLGPGGEGDGAADESSSGESAIAGDPSPSADTGGSSNAGDGGGGDGGGQ